MVNGSGDVFRHFRIPFKTIYPFRFEWYIGKFYNFAVMKRILIIATSILWTGAFAQLRELIWSDEFDADGTLSEQYWNFEEGFVRNHELQWYQPQNAYCKDGVLVLEARAESFPNPNYTPDSDEWRRQREEVEVTSASVNTRGKMEFQYGTVEVRAKIPTASGAWPAIWTLGKGMRWPSNGEIDIMEYYQIDGVPYILANAACGTDSPFEANWNTMTVPFSHFLEKDPNWADKFHVWKMDWNKDALKIYLDDELINDIPVSSIKNGFDGNYTNPMQQPHYFLLDLAIGGDHGGPLDKSALPLRYEIDYVRIYR